jgi:hypothetical protein
MRPNSELEILTGLSEPAARFFVFWYILFRMRETRPLALLVNPPIYDFALYDLYLKPYGLLRVQAWLEAGGWDTLFVNALDYEDGASAALLGRPRRRADGTGKFFRRPVSPPPELERAAVFQEEIPRRRFARYGIIEEAFRERLAASPGTPDLVLVTSGMTYWYPGVRETVRICRSLYPHTPVLAGGIYASLMPGHCEKAGMADAVIRDGSSQTLAALLKSFRLPAPEGPYPAFPPAESSAWKDSAVLRLSTGCPFSCDYCASRLFFPRFEAGDAEAAFESFAAFMKAGIRNFAFYDDALLARKEKVFLPFLERVIGCFGDAAARDAPRFFLPNAVHIQSLDAKTAVLMRRAGFQEIRMGFESSSAVFHEEHGSGAAKFRPECFPESLRMLLDSGFTAESLCVYILAGLPGQKAGEVEDSIRAARESLPAGAAGGIRIRLAEYSPVPASALWEKALRHSRYPLAEEPLFHNNSLFPMEWEGFTRADLRRLKNMAR